MQFYINFASKNFLFDTFNANNYQKIMKQSYLLDDRDFDELFKKLWKEKFFILIITAIFSLLFYFYPLSFFKKFRTEIIIKNPPAHLFMEYDKFYKFYVATSPNNSTYDQYNIYDTNLRINLLSKSNLEKFLEHNKNFQNSNFLKKNVKKNSYSENFKLTFKLTTNNENKYSLIFPEGLDGKVLLTDYINYTKNITLIQSKNNLKIALKEISLSMISDLEISKKYPASSLQSQSNLENFYDPKILSNRINILNSLMEKLDKHYFNYDIILISASDPSVASSIVSFYPFLGILLAFSFSVLIVIFRDKIKRK
jgi:LPS O-antigen subunit length determinant protein (WzzB/FepE family)